MSSGFTDGSYLHRITWGFQGSRRNVDTTFGESELFFLSECMVSPMRPREAMLLAIIGSSAYKLLRRLVSPAKADEKFYKELVEAIKKHHNPTSSKIVQRYKFNSCFKKESKSIATYLSELRSIAQHYHFHSKKIDLN